jgi:O-antigen ligase
MRSDRLFFDAPSTRRQGRRGHQSFYLMMVKFLNRRVPADWVIFWAFVLGIAWCPFLFGGDDLLAWGINAIIFPALAVIYEISLLARGMHHPLAITYLRVPALLFAIVLLWTVVQNATWTPENWHHPIWDMASDALQRPLEGSISVNRDLTALAQLRLIIAASVFWLAVQLCRDGLRAQMFLRSVAVIASLYAAYGLIAYALMPDFVLWAQIENGVGFTRSTFVNRNNFATYAGLGFLSICGVLFKYYRQEVMLAGGSVGFTLSTLIETLGRRGAMRLGGAFVTLVALLLTGSRGGILATFLGLFILAVLFFTRRSTRPTRSLETIIFSATLLGAVFITFGDTFLGRFESSGIYDEGRLTLNRLTSGSIANAPLLGFGYGTFADVFPMYRDRSITNSLIVDKAHNDYLELLQGLGVPAGLMLITCVGMLVLKCVGGATRRRRNSTVPCVAASAGFLVGVHALVDFSLQFQGVALTFMALLGAGIAQSESSQRSVGD